MFPGLTATTWIWLLASYGVRGELELGRLQAFHIKGTHENAFGSDAEGQPAKPNAQLFKTLCLATFRTECAICVS
jgi:hypothetical protein